MRPSLGPVTLITGIVVIATAVSGFALAPAANAGSDSSASTGGTNNAVMITLSGSRLTGITSTAAALTPSFRTADTDYVWFCAPGVNQITLTLSSKGIITEGGQSGSQLTVPVAVVANQAVIVTAANGIQYWIRCLPASFPHFTVKNAGGGGAGYYVTESFENASSPGYPLILNSYGTPVWYLTGVPLSADNTSLVPGTHDVTWDLRSTYAIYNLDTASASSLRAPVEGFDPHELFYDTSGDAWMVSKPEVATHDLAAIGYPGVSKMQDCVVQEVDPQGQLIWQWNASAHVDPNEAYPNLTSVFQSNGGSIVDTYHCNSIDVDPLDSNHILVSMRNVGVFLIDKATGTITWKLGGTSAPTLQGEPVLTITNDPETTFVGQHDARFEPDGNVSLYDDETHTTQTPRGVEYSTNASTNSANMVWEYVSPGKGPKNSMGSVRMYDANTLPYDQVGSSYLGVQDTVVNWGRGAPRGGFTVVGNADQVLMDVLYPSRFISYRTQMVPAGALNLTELRASAGTAFTSPG